MPDKDERRIQIACMRDRPYKIPWQKFCNQMTFPCELKLLTTSAGLKLFREPVREINRLYSISHNWSYEKVSAATKFVFSEYDLLDIKSVIKPDNVTNFSFVIKGVPIEYDVRKEEIRCEGVVAPLRIKGNRTVELRILADRVSLEIFGNGGEVSLSVYANPIPEVTSSYISVTGGAVELEKLEVAELRSIFKDQ